MEAFIHRHIHDLLTNATRPVFICDERIDGDSLGSSLALAHYLKGRGVPVPVFISEAVPEPYRFLPGIEQTTTDVDVFQDPAVDIVVVFDCSDADFVRGLMEPMSHPPTLVNIDHHATNPRYGDVNQVIVEAPATAQVVHQFFVENQIVPSRDIATCLLTGICFDTTVFSNAATGERALNAASELMICGGRIQDVIRHIYQSRSVSALRIWGEALSRLTTHTPSGAVFTFMTHDDLKQSGLGSDEVDGLSNFLQLVVDAHTLFVIKEREKGELKVSIRSSVHDVSRVAKAFGGGGHHKAAGFVAPNGTFVCDEAGCRELVEKAMAVLK
ncbi:DHH family phosphoesterase [Candidatus Uhrbacteria bacterium]|nr:DHH family phosphoesterase [Candidatus Uhrbacteria bacterium]